MEKDSSGAASAGSVDACWADRRPDIYLGRRRIHPVCSCNVPRLLSTARNTLCLVLDALTAHSMWSIGESFSIAREAPLRFTLRCVLALGRSQLYSEPRLAGKHIMRRLNGPILTKFDGTQVII